jgi:aryl-alcohol dehydrogenase-like predicted oxidoreductase
VKLLAECYSVSVTVKSVFALPRRALGRTRLQLSVLGFGTAPLGDLFVQLDDSTPIDTVGRAFGLGINLLDSSPLYDGTMRSVEQSLLRLGTDRLDLSLKPGTES